ncbi:hypothetical protein SNE40_013663 [Patella caerulea]|uniref:Uncharacterized protein n=1 Tax=Patella caerulea TaxID=87958 RepID=A0AAN8JC23_PATCE
MMSEYTKDVTRLLLAFLFLHSVSFTDGSNCDNSIASVSICSFASQRGRTVHLTGVLGNVDGIGCGCALHLINDNSGPGAISIANITSAPSNCDYDIDSSYKTNVKRIFSCGNYEQNAQFDLIQGEEVVLRLEKGTSNVGAMFCLEITSTPGSEVDIECSKTSTTTVPATNTDSTDKSYTTTVPSTDTNTDTTDKSYTTTVPATGINTDTTDNSNTKTSTPKNSFSQTAPSSEDETGFIVGIILAVIILVTLISLVICVLYRKAKKVKNMVVPGDVKQIKH